MSSTTGNTIERELYQTPASAVAALMRCICFRPADTFMEPCRAEGNIYNPVPLPLEQKEWAEISQGRDYLAWDFGRQFDVIITNPPFSLTEEFLKKSQSELAPGGTLIYLQRVNFLGSKKRVPFWAEVGFPNKTPILVPRPRFVNGGSDSCEYSWFIWDNGNRVNLPNGLSHLIAEDAA
ncbi:class I SAM-dependent methyltransferase [Aeromonas bestiarum]|uniref:Class I SAM-dependent methyltransferase n=1 Tax=Aeromonas bestiarum TaxID=105751 RepID=A0AAW7I067_9GAMM|nr:DNA methyltransferase [Aeromonas bestiarum]MDM5141556.1 class I SAM-dependent methyltransferase [Aeromonas bestiarum]